MLIYYFISLSDNLNPIIYKNKHTIITIKQRIIGSIKHNSFDSNENISKELIMLLLLFIYIYFIDI